MGPVGDSGDASASNVHEASEHRKALLDRRAFRDRVQYAVAYASRYETMFAILHLDLDDFNAANTVLRRDEADALLETMGTRLVNNVRRSDAVARVGGDEFAILLSRIVRPDDAARSCEKLLNTLERPIRINGHEFRLTASIGISVFPFEDADADILMQNADAAMHEAKRRGKCGFQYYSSDLAARVAARLQLESDLHRALETDELAVYYQPKVDTFSTRFLSAEALVRWEHPEQGLIPPSAFIPTAELSNLIIAVGDRVNAAAFREARSWQQAGCPIGLSINLSMRQFERDNLVERMMESVVAANLDTTLLQVEVTESVFLRDATYVRGVLKKFQELGISVAIDDFGTGYSSLSLLQELPIDTLKIDKSFIEGIPRCDGSLAIVETIVQMGRNLGLTLVAEGVETMEQWEFLKEVGCDQCQGFLFARPAPAHEFTDLLKRNHSAGGSSSSGFGVDSSAVQ